MNGVVQQTHIPSGNAPGSSNNNNNNNSINSSAARVPRHGKKQSISEFED